MKEHCSAYRSKENPTEIPKLVFKSRTVFVNYLRSPGQHRIGDSTESTRKVDATTQKRINKAVINKKSFIEKFIRNLIVAILILSNKQYGAVCKGKTYLKTENYKKVINLLQQHKETRVEWAMDHIEWKISWTVVLFFVERKFNVDGAVGVKHYWHDLCWKPLQFYGKHTGGRSVMVWAELSLLRKIELCFVHSTMNSEVYIDVLENDLLPFA